MKQFLFYLMASLLFTSCGSKPAPQREVSLFSIHGEEALLIPQNKKLNRYRLVLSGVSNRVFYFQGKPIEKGHEISLGYFFQCWKDPTYGFKKALPRAALMTYIPRKKGILERESVLLKLSNPVYLPDKDELSFQAVVNQELSHWVVARPMLLTDLLIEAKLKKDPIQVPASQH